VPRRAAGAVVALVLALAAGCAGDDPSAALMTDYLYRVGNAVDRELDTRPWREAPLTAFAYPDRSALTVDVPTRRVDFLAFLKLHRCPLGELIAERNSALGRVMGPVRRWHYEARLLIAADACLATLEREGRSPEVAAKLADLIAVKRGDYAAHQWNALFASPEWQRHFTFTERAYHPVTDAPEMRATVEALRGIAARLDDPAALAATDIETLEHWFAAIEHNAGGGRLLEAMRLMLATLDEAAAGLASRVDGRALCPLGKATPKARIAFNVFVKFYAGGLQPYLAETLQAYEHWHALTHAILSRAEGGDPRHPWFRLLDARFAPASIRRSIEGHTDAWQALLTQCDLMPTDPADVRGPDTAR